MLANIEVFYNKIADRVAVIVKHDAEFYAFTYNKRTHEILVLFRYDIVSTKKASEVDRDIILFELSAVLNKNNTNKHEFELMKKLILDFDKLTDKLAVVSAVEFLISYATKAVLHDELLDDIEKLDILRESYNNIIYTLMLEKSNIIEDDAKRKASELSKEKENAGVLE